jgi:SAM-dependent methyltransferase
VTGPTSTPARFRCTHCAGAVPLAGTGGPGLRCPQCHETFSLDRGIVMLEGAPQEDRDYPEALVDLVAHVEQRHFWFAARNDVILATLRRAAGSLAGARVLDIGCGTGFVTAALEASGMDAWGIDMHHAALSHARARMRGPLFSAHSAVLPFFSDFQVATLFDVIEHLDDDVAALRQAATVVEPNGLVVVTVPAGPHLWTAYDEVIGHKRRYDRDTLVTAVKRAGLELLEVSYFSCLPLLAQAAQRAMTPRPRASRRDTVEIVRHALRVPIAPLNALFRWSSAAELPLRRLRWMRGGSLIAVARR